MLYLQSYRYLYINRSTLLDTDALLLFEELAKRKICIRLYLENVSDVECVKQMPAFAYVSEILYHAHFLGAIEANMAQHHIRKAQVCVLTKNEVLDTELNAITIGKACRYTCLYDIYVVYHKEIRRLRTLIGSFMFINITYVTCFLNQWFTFPSWLQTDQMHWLTLGVPLLCLLLVSIYGISKRLFACFEILDVFT